MEILQDFSHALLWAEFALCIPVFVALMFVAAPYGRFSTAKAGARTGPRLGWFIMELPALLVMPIFWALTRSWTMPTRTVFLLIWLLHYAQRDIVYPALMRSHRPMPLAIMFAGFFFNLMNGWVNAWWLFGPEAAPRSADWLRSAAFLGGLAVFIAGYALNLWSDRILRELRRGLADGEYAVPMKGPHRLVASPNYLGECLEWCGWAILTWSPAGLAFALFTVANLAPRARKNLQWYRKTFPEYPPGRKAILPFLF